MIASKKHSTRHSVQGDNTHEKLDPIKMETDPIGYVAEKCTECGVCVQQCDFLKKHGAPGTIATQYLSGEGGQCEASFYCNLCSLCSAVCPEGLLVRDMFHVLRRAAVREGKGRFKEHRPILNYEKIGSSWPFANYLLPDRCTTVFFPGCTFPAIYPGQTLELFDFLAKQIPRLGFVFNCCNKPSHDLGLQRNFLEEFGRKTAVLRDHGVTEIITVCPNCFQNFRQYGGDFEVSMVYTHLARYKDHFDNVTGIDVDMQVQGNCTIHDPCVTRFESDIQQAVRAIAQNRGLQIKEMAHNRDKTQCCGEGGAVSLLAGKEANGWKEKRLNEAGELPLLTYCAGCSVMLFPRKTRHILDILFPGKGKNQKIRKPASAPFTYLNRLFLKWKVVKNFRKRGATFLLRR